MEETIKLKTGVKQFVKKDITLPFRIFKTRDTAAIGLYSVLLYRLLYHSDTELTSENFHNYTIYDRSSAEDHLEVLKELGFVVEQNGQLIVR